MDRLEIDCTSRMGDKMTIEDSHIEGIVYVSVLEECISDVESTITIGKYEAELIIEYLKAKFEI